ncbi:MAG TPA: hypothetical protein VMH04_24135 [Candidatus Solibacter sp.]|nr:hypothetical protein [Candidatus Solibacter sp.]
MRIALCILWLVAGASAQQVFAPHGQPLPPEAESILISSCREIGERLGIPMPDPRVELRLGEKHDAMETDDDHHIIHLRRWNKARFREGALHICMRAAERQVIPAMLKKPRDD